jgi:hypothetical protein
MKHVYTIIILILLVPFNSKAQVADYAMEVMAELSDTAYHGRGYYEQGDLKAARYIASEYDKHGLTQWNSTWFQPYSFNVNTFQSDNRLEVNGKRLAPGIDYVLRSYSSGLEGDYTIHLVDTLDFDEEEAISELKALPESVIPVCDMGFARQHRTFYRQLYSTKSKGCILLWKEPLKFYKAYSSRLYPACIAWVSYDNWPENAKTLSIDIDNHMIDDYETQNVIGYIEGSETPDEWVVFTAHYDHLGMFGRDTWFPGANDNASGVAMLLNVAKHYKDNPPAKSLAFVAVSGEECGLLGSKHYVENPVFPLENIDLVINLDMIADNGDSLYVQCNEPAEEDFNLMKTYALEKNYFKGFDRDTLSPHSDHYPFVEKDVPAVFFSTHGDMHPHYHTPLDDMEHITTEKFILIFDMIRQYLDAS